MAKRGPRGPADLPDYHLWLKVRETVTPLRPEPVVAIEEPPHLPMPPETGKPAVAGAKRRYPQFAMPSYQSDGRPQKGPRPGIEPNLRQRLIRGRDQIDGTLDLHGMRQAEAHLALTRFIRARAERGDRTLLVITGKGLKKLSDDAAVIVERGVLRAMLPFWLASPDLAPLVSGWDVAAQGHGGDGAFYVRLRRLRETK
jgi:DNA-nicking Smr family endonuclease